MLSFLVEVLQMQEKYLCGALIKQIHDELEKKANASLREQDLTLAQMNVLMELESVPGHRLSLKELEGLLHVAQSTTAGIVTRLEQKGYVESFADVNDRRVKNVCITASGMECCINAQSHIKTMEENLLSGLTESEQVQFCDFLKRVSKGVYLWK